MRSETRLKLKHASGWALLGAWFFFGGCASQEQQGTTTRTVLDVIGLVCPPEITVGECVARVEAYLALQPADAGTE
jgi:hypothetical protein